MHIVEAKVAREVLRRANTLTKQLWLDPTGDLFFAIYSGSLALLASVDDALRVRDGKAPEFKAAYRKWKAELRNRKGSSDSDLYWRFIQKERNLVLHEAQANAGQNVAIMITGVAAQGMVAGDKPTTATLGESTSKYTYTMTGGHFRDRDLRRLLADASNWWDLEIEKIEKSAAV
ncbi:MAG: hypothetical protein JWM36_3342 [Hyphomicrobiales bacterium]|nr:hypothetical protein [Hyphomicrobiales bacterium]